VERELYSECTEAHHHHWIRNGWSFALHCHSFQQSIGCCGRIVSAGCTAATAAATAITTSIATTAVAAATAESPPSTGATGRALQHDGMEAALRAYACQRQRVHEVL
jgi:hypothetical protein